MRVLAIAAELRRAVAEFVGTGLLVGIGTGAIVGGSRLGGLPILSLAVAWFLAVWLPMALFLRISGAHLNPAVTFALAGSGRFPWRLAPGFWIAQCSGALAGSAIVLGWLGDGHHLGATVPTGVPLPLAAAGEAAFTALLVATVFYLSDLGEGRARWRTYLPPIAVGLSTYVIGPWTGSSLNPARTLAPALLSQTYTDLALYLLVVPAAAGLVALAWAAPTGSWVDRRTIGKPGSTDARSGAGPSDGSGEVGPDGFEPSTNRL